MITLITGLPGNGKTLFGLWHIKQRAERETREVYYHNIKDLTLAWTPFEAEKWMDLPHGSIIVFDEGQFVFSKKPNGSKLPEWYEQLATHRHRGFDIYIITQHPSLLDNFVRQLAGQHYHVVRKFGLQRATIYEWSATNPAPQNIASQKSAIPFKWAYPKEVYGYYKSAEVHTVKRAIPAKLFMAVGLVIGVLALGYWALNRYQHRTDKLKAEATSQTQLAASAGSSPVRPGGVPAAEFDPVADVKHYVAMETPRIAGLPQTAPKYDGLTVPVRVPVPAACIQIGDVRSKRQVGCKCFSQQGTPMDVGFNMCVEFARNGYFQDFDAERDQKQVARTEAGVAAMSDRPDAPVRDRERGPSVVAFATPVDDVPRPVGRPKAATTGALGGAP
jgi:zona occludens toxin